MRLGWLLLTVTLRRIILFYAITAVLTLFCNTISYPRDPDAILNVELLQNVPSLIRRIPIRKLTLGELIHLQYLDGFTTELAGICVRAISKTKQNTDNPQLYVESKELWRYVYLQSMEYIRLFPSHNQHQKRPLSTTLGPFHNALYNTVSTIRSNKYNDTGEQNGQIKTLLADKWTQ